MATGKSNLSVFVFLCIGTAANSARATLGEKVGPTASDSSASVRAQSVQPSGAYNVHETATAGYVVREYALPSGVVFGIAWTGAAQPDLEKLLGSYYADYQGARTERRQNRRRAGNSRSVSTPRLVVQHGGHARKIHGRAYDPSLMPEGVKPDDIQ